MPDETCELTAQHVWGGHAPERDRRKRARVRVPALTILYHPDVRRIGEQAQLDDLLDGRAAYLSRSEPELAPPGQGGGRPLNDLHISRTPLRLLPHEGGVRLDAAESRTRVQADGVWVDGARDFTALEVRRGVVLELSDRVVLLLHTLSLEPFRAPSFPGLIGESEAIVRVRNEIRRVADLEVPVLIRGETGTGKELVARAIHQASRRRDKAYLSVNMGAIPPSLATSELFGSARGAFTGSVRDQAGYFQKAHDGTLFLDEIGEASAEVQVMLLRVLETGEIQRVGSPDAQKVDVRLLAATDADLEKAIQEGRFRGPLLHRLSGYEVSLPPLRERRDDFGRLLFFFIRQELQAIGEERRLEAPQGTEPAWMPASIVARLARHPWPGNIRQLRNAARQIVIDSRSFDTVQVGPQIERLLREASRPVSEAVPVSEPAPAVEAAPRRRAEAVEYRSPAEVSEEELLAALRAHRWEIKAAAEHLGIARPSLYLLMEKFPGLRKAVDLSRAEILEARAVCGGNLEAMVSQLEVSKKGLLQRMKQLGIG